MAENKKIAKIVVNRDLCIGAASCITIAGEVFELDGENKAVMLLKSGQRNSGPALKNDLFNESVSDETILSAAQSCPTKAILLYDDEGNQIYP